MKGLIDFVVVKLKLKLSANHEIGGSRQIDETMLIHVLSDSTEAYELRLIPLDKNISITFEIPQDVISMNNSDRIKVDFDCVWYNGSEKSSTTSQQWSNFGCNTMMNYSNYVMNSIVCQCNHMTTFGILWHLQDSEKDSENDFFDQYSQHWSYGIILSMFIVSFLAVSIYIAKLFYILKIKYKIAITLCRYKNKKNNQACEPAFAILLFCLIQSIGQSVSCFLFLLFAVVLPNISENNVNNFSDSDVIYDFFREFVTFGLFLPMVSSFYIYSCVIYSLSVISNSLTPRVESIRKKTFHVAIVSNIFITIFLLIFAMCLVFDIDVVDFTNGINNNNQSDNGLGDSNSTIAESYFFFISAMFYIMLLFISLILASYFTYAARKTIKATLHLFKTANGENIKDLSAYDKALKRILMSFVALVLLLSVQTGLLLIFMIDLRLFDPSMQMIEIFFHLLYLIFVLKFYKNYVQAKMDDKIQQSLVFVVLFDCLCIIFKCIMIYDCCCYCLIVEHDEKEKKARIKLGQLQPIEIKGVSDG